VRDYEEVVTTLDNSWAVDSAGLAIVVAMARKAQAPILEIGSGLSTVFMAAATDQTVYCVEHCANFARQTAALAREAGVQNIGVCISPLKEGWYDPAEFDGLPESFDLAFVDGPPRGMGDRMRFFDYFDAKAILLDDADELAYAEKLHVWAEEHDRDIRFPSSRVALIRRKSLAQGAIAA
jgi:hypothetical protein